MKHLIVIFLLISTPLFSQRANDIIYVPSDNSILISQTVNNVGFYLGGQYFTQYPYPYTYNTPYAFLNRFGAEVKMFNDVSLMVGGYSKNMGTTYPPNQIRPELWIKTRLINTLTDQTNDLDFVVLVRASHEFYYGLGLFVKW